MNPPIETNLDNLNWQKLIAPYAKADPRKSWMQVATSFLPFLLLWAAMMWSLDVSYWLTLALAIPTAGFMVRTFIIFHDCCHGAFFKGRKDNDTLGSILGVFMFTPYHHWKHNHNVHHATAGDLDRRGVGDVYTMTLEEYRQAPKLTRIGYRIMRNPVFLFTLGSFSMFAFIQRAWRGAHTKKERDSVIYTNLAIVVLLAVLMLIFGWKEVLLVQVPMMFVATSVGVWMFFVQHQFPGVYWERHSNWSFVRACLTGCSYYKLPKILQWFTGNIGFHHIHHLGPKVPNYNLEACQKDNPIFQVKPLMLWESFKCARLALYDEANRKMVGFEAV